MKYKIDVVRIRENYITLNGWAIGKKYPGGVTVNFTSPWISGSCLPGGTM